MSIFFFFNDTATTEIYTLSLHDALPICLRRITAARREKPLPRLPAAEADDEVLAGQSQRPEHIDEQGDDLSVGAHIGLDRKSTRLNSSHANISYAVFCLKKKKKTFRYNV